MLRVHRGCPGCALSSSSVDWRASWSWLDVGREGQQACTRVFCEREKILVGSREEASNAMLTVASTSHLCWASMRKSRPRRSQIFGFDAVHLFGLVRPKET